MSDFRQLSNKIWASPQISAKDIANASKLGFALVVNNRPDGESDDQPEGASIEAAAIANGMTYCAIPITHAGFSDSQVAQMADALESANGPVLAYCRSGTRSTFLWSLAQAKLGRDLEELTAAAAAAGYDLSSIRPLLDIYKAQAHG